ncbi:hypothetical protein BH18ACT7_BH18ACT7_17040 [soil metagenome]
MSGFAWRRLPLLLAGVLLVVLVAAVARAGPYAAPRPPAAVTPTATATATPGLATPDSAEEQAREEENEALASIPAL